MSTKYLEKNTRSAGRFSPSLQASMSAYFPAGTQYFYGYPAAVGSGFLNKVPPATEELVAARTLSCAGPQVSVVSFASTSAPHIDCELLSALAIPQGDPSLLTILPKGIDTNLQGKQRDDAIMAALAESIAPGSLVMAQPFTDKIIEDLYQTPPKLTVWLNDKANMTEYIDPALIPERLSSYTSGADFAADSNIATNSDLLPFVVKVSSSSSGDGVYICFSPDDTKNAQAAVATSEGSVFIEQYIRPLKNYAVHFGIAHDSHKAIDIIGFNEQLTTADGEFLGGIIDGNAFPAELESIRESLEKHILPKVRSKGWYGIGGFDVIIGEDKKAYLIDCNFRMTGMSAYHFLIANGKITQPMVSFDGKYRGSRDAFERAILPYTGKDSQHRVLQLIALNQHGDRWNFNGALMYGTQSELRDSITQLLNAGITSPALAQLLNRA